MPLDLPHVLEVADLWLLVLLLVPKRHLGDLRLRLHELSAGRRRWLFEPPRGFGSGRPSGAQRAFAEAARVFELGVPLYVAGRLAEERSAHVRLEARSQWPESVPALLAAHVLGSNGDSELAVQLRARGLPMPAEKAVGRMARSRPALPMDWWLDKEREPVAPNGEGAEVSPLEPAASEPETVTSVVEPIARVGPTLLEIHTMGRIEILESDEDLSRVMLSRPVLAFLWLYLLVRALLNPRDRVMRTELAAYHCRRRRWSAAASSSGLRSGSNGGWSAESTKRRATALHTRGTESSPRRTRSRNPPRSRKHLSR